MYAQVEKTKENKSSAVANSVRQKKSNTKQGFGFVDNWPEAIAQRRLLDSKNIASKQVTPPEGERSIIQRVPHFKIFERNGEKPVVGEGLTKLGVRRAELTIGEDDVVYGRMNNIPQGMSVSDTYEEEEIRKKGKSNEGIFKIDSSQFNKELKVRLDPQAASHYLVGPEGHMKYIRLHNLVGKSVNKWKKVGVVGENMEWERTQNPFDIHGKDKRGEILWKQKLRKDKARRYREIDE